MLERLLDQAALKQACGLDHSEYANAATLGLLPRACGTFNALPLWTETAAKAFASDVGKEFNDEWCALSVNLSTHLNSASAELTTTTHTSEPESREWPDEMLRQHAVEYLGVAGSLLDKAIKSGLLNCSHEGRYVVFRRKDLDAFAELPQFKRRIRRQKRDKDKIVSTLKEKPALKMANDQTLLTEKAAADHLNIHYGALALSRKYGTGPTVAIDAAGVPRYRLADLNEFRERHLAHHEDARARTETLKVTRHDGTTIEPPKKTVIKAGDVATATTAADPVDALKPGDSMTAAEIAQRWGVKPKSIDNWQQRGGFPQRIPGSLKGKLARFRVSDVSAWAAEHYQSIENSRRLIASGNMGQHSKRGPSAIKKANGAAKSTLKKTRKAPAAGGKVGARIAKAPTLGGVRVRH